jgi:hypothetical protein
MQDHGLGPRADKEKETNREIGPSEVVVASVTYYVITSNMARLGLFSMSVLLNDYFFFSTFILFPSQKKKISMNF